MTYLLSVIWGRPRMMSVIEKEWNGGKDRMSHCPFARMRTKMASQAESRRSHSTDGLYDWMQGRKLDKRNFG